METLAAKGRQRTLIIACGALSREIVQLDRANGWSHMTITCLPASWHNRPEKIPEGVRRKIRAGKKTHERILVLYADCGTGGLLDKVIEEEGVERIGGPHCYAFYSGLDDFAERFDAEPTCFFLTEYTVRHLDRLIVKGLWLDRYPELLPQFFGNYTKLVYLAQTDDADLRSKAQGAAERLGLAYEYRQTGYGDLAHFIAAAR